MSYNYVDKALFAAPGYFLRTDERDLEFFPGHIWPQSLWVQWLLLKADLIKGHLSCGELMEKLISGSVDFRNLNQIK